MPEWLTTPCGNGPACVQVLKAEDRVFLRSSVNRDRVLDLDVEEWGPFLEWVKSGALD